MNDDDTAGSNLADNGLIIYILSGREKNAASFTIL